MAVKFDVVYKNNRRLPMQGPCFGAFSFGEFSTGGLRTLDAQRVELTNTEARNLAQNAEDAAFIQFYGEPEKGYWKVQGDRGDEYVRRYYEHMKELIDDIPWLKASVHPLVGVIRVPVKNVPADKVMMTLFLVRNLAHYEHANTYRKFLEMGYKPFACAILSSFWSYCKGTAFTSDRWIYNSVGEYNWLSPGTFGKQALKQLVQAGSDFNPWFLDTWGQLKGYRRDRWFQTERHLFNPDNRRNIESNQNKFRKMIDCLSIQNDEPIFSFIQAESIYQGSIYIGWKLEKESGQISPDEMDQALGEFNNQCLEHGYNPFR